MNANKARDFFSEYFDGGMDEGLKQSFELALSRDEALREDYAQFESAMKMLADADFSEAPLPSDLHDKIMARLDLHDYESKRSAKPGLFGSWKLSLYGGVAVIAIVSAVFALSRPPSGQRANEANLLPSQTQKSLNVDVKSIGGKLSLVVENAVRNAVVVRELGGGKESKFTVGPAGMQSELTNQDLTAVALEAVVDQKPAFVIVLPGSNQGGVYEGAGDVIDCAKAIADAYRAPIMVRVSDRTKSIEWKLSPEGGLRGQLTKLSDAGVSLSVRNDGLVLMTD